MESDERWLFIFYFSYSSPAYGADRGVDYSQPPRILLRQRERESANEPRGSIDSASGRLAEIIVPLKRFIT